uniref:Uncharacterized protein n=1 Tax=Leersia perrieri TaxID=77586 RepID=A0A0D9WVV5_9ORYZ
MLLGEVVLTFSDGGDPVAPSVAGIVCGVRLGKIGRPGFEGSGSRRGGCFEKRKKGKEGRRSGETGRVERDVRAAWPTPDKWHAEWERGTPGWLSGP